MCCYVSSFKEKNTSARYIDCFSNRHRVYYKQNCHYVIIKQAMLKEKGFENTENIEASENDIQEKIQSYNCCNDKNEVR